MKRKRSKGAPKQGGSGWTGEDIAKIVTNPIYVGIGPYPAVLPDDQWIAAVSSLIRERGANVVLRDMLRNLREAFPPPSDVESNEPVE